MKFLKSAFLFGLLFLVSASSLSAQELTVFAGLFKPHFYEDNHEISGKQFKAKILGDKEAGLHWKDYTKKRNLSLVGAGIALGSLAWASYNIKEEKNMALPLIGFFGGLGLELGSAISALKKYRLALLTYNENVDTRTTSTTPKASFKLAPTYNGAGLVVTF